MSSTDNHVQKSICFKSHYYNLVDF